MTSSPLRLITLTAVLTAVFVLSAWSAGGVDPEHLPRDLVLLALNTLPLLALGPSCPRRAPLRGSGCCFSSARSSSWAAGLVTRVLLNRAR